MYQHIELYPLQLLFGNVPVAGCLMLAACCMQSHHEQTSIALSFIASVAQCLLRAPQVIGLEKTLGFFWEQRIQGFFLQVSSLFRTCVLSRVLVSCLPLTMSSSSPSMVCGSVTQATASMHASLSLLMQGISVTRGFHNITVQLAQGGMLRPHGPT